MPVVNKLTYNLMISLQAGFAGVLLGFLVNLFLYQYPEGVAFPVTVGLLVCAGIFLFRLKKRVRQYVFRFFNYNYLYFYSSFLQFIILLLLLLSIWFAYDENNWIALWGQFIGFFMLFILFLEGLVLQVHPLQWNTDLGAGPGSSSFGRHVVGLVSLSLFGLLSFYLCNAAGGALVTTLQITFSLLLALFLPFLGLRVVFFKWLRTTGEKEKKVLTKTPARAADPAFMLHKSYFYLERNLEEVLVHTKEEDRSFICGKIRQLPLIDKIEDLDFLRKKYLPNDEELAYTLHFLSKTREELLKQGASFDIDTAASLLEIKACIRTVIMEGNSMLVQKLLNDSRPEVKKAAVFASVHFRDPSMIPNLVDLLKDPEFAFSAQEALFEFGEQCLSFLRSAKYRNKHNSFFIEQCLQLVSSFNCTEARDFLVEMLNEPQKRFQFKAAVSLLENGYALGPLQKTQILHFIDSLIGTIAILREIYCKLSSSYAALMEALKEEELEKRDLVISLFGAFLSKELLKQNRQLFEEGDGQHRTVLYAFIDLHFPLVLRTKCKILFGSGADENIAAALQTEYLQEKVFFDLKSGEEAIQLILKMDYGQVGYWLRACALKQMASSAGQQPSVHLLAEVFNKNQLLQEIACETLYDLNFDYYFLYMQRLPAERAKLLKHKIETFKINSTRNKATESHLQYHQVLFFKSHPFFEEFPYESLSRALGMFTLVNLGNEKRKLNFDPYKPNGYWIVYQGAFAIYYRGEVVLEGQKGDIIDMSFLTEAEKQSVSIQPIGKSTLEEEVTSMEQYSGVVTHPISFPKQEGMEVVEEILVYFIEYSSFNKLYLKTENSKKFLSQPRLNQSQMFPVA